MALVLKDRVLETSNTTGTSDFLCGGAQTGFQTWSVIGNGSTAYYCIQGKNTDGSLTGEWEVGLGTYSSATNTVARTTVYESSNSNALVNFSAGAKDIYLDYPAEAINAGLGVTQVTGTAPITSSGGTTPAIGLPKSTSTVDGYLSSTDWTTFNGKQPAGSYAPATSGTSILYGNGAGGFSSVTIGTNLTFTAGTLNATAGGGSGTVTSVSGAGTVNGLTLTGTVTTSGSLTLGGTLSLVSPPAIGGTTPAQITGTNIIANTQVYTLQVTPTALTATGTLTIANLLTNIITVTSATAVSLTLPTGTLTDAGILAGAGATNNSFNWSIINLGSSAGIVTLVAGTAHTIVGLVTIPISSQAMFRTRKTAANTYVTYRIA